MLYATATLPADRSQRSEFSPRISATRGKSLVCKQLICLAFAIALAACNPSTVVAANLIAGSAINLTNTSTAPNGAWSWFEDERAIVDDNDPSNPLLLVSSVSAGTGNERGDIDLVWLNLATGERGEFELHNTLQQDDHNSAALWVRPDGRYVAAYGKHNADDLMLWRVSSNPGDPSAWEPSSAIDVSPGTTARATYNNLHYLPDDENGAGRLYNFTRSTNFDPNIVVSDDEGVTWSYAGKLLTEGGSGTRPYLRYSSDGSRIHFIATQAHPRQDRQNSIYHGYVEDGALHDSAGRVVDNNLFDGSAVQTSRLTSVFAAGTVVGGVEMTRGWTIDVAVDAEGSPVAVFTMRARDDANDHRFFYGAYRDGSWEISQLAKAGGFLYAAESDYTGLASIDSNDPSTVVISTKIDPRTDLEMPHYELFRGSLNAETEGWDWAPITFRSTVDNLRPVIPKWGDDQTALVWMRGDYNTYIDWTTDVFALADLNTLDDLYLSDFNRDGQLNAIDYRVFISNINADLSAYTLEEASRRGDLTGDGRVTFEDLQLFKREFDFYHGDGAFSSAYAIVPEPSGIWIVLCSILTACSRQVVQ